MTKPVTVGWIRHGVTEWNQLGKIQGVTDIPLSDEGVSQARLLAERLASDGMRWDGVVSSDLKRAATTARVIADRLGLPHETDARLRERSFGRAEGTTLAERLALWGEDWRKNVPDQEPNASLEARGFAFVGDLVTARPGQSWLVVTHGSFLSTMMKAMCGDLDDGYIQNVSLTVLEERGGGWKPLIHNCTLHLQASK
ncbi:histidine phosphatase family protein [Cohnella sp. GCM10027633]|uniref:histidine phosphatase family protein n=1 Tax=unclassified Cohnella TaxID=2636738 RepID=UPI00364110A7